jgi:hypothetical protein
MFHFVLAGALALAPSHIVKVGAYEKVVCDQEPDPAQCQKIQFWYLTARSNDGISCCGLGDAYWTDKTDKVTKDGLYVTITDPRSCKGPAPGYDDEAGEAAPDTEMLAGCIRKPDLDGKQLWIPNDKIDRKHQGNPTGHIVTFVNPTGNAVIYDPDGKTFLSVYCYLPGGGF